MGNEPELAIASILFCHLAHPLTEHALSPSLESHLFICNIPWKPPHPIALCSGKHRPFLILSIPFAFSISLGTRLRCPPGQQNFPVNDFPFPLYVLCHFWCHAWPLWGQYPLLLNPVRAPNFTDLNKNVLDGHNL